MPVNLVCPSTCTPSPGTRRIISRQSPNLPNVLHVAIGTRSVNPDLPCSVEGSLSPSLTSSPSPFTSATTKRHGQSRKPVRSQKLDLGAAQNNNSNHADANRGTARMRPKERNVLQSSCSKKDLTKSGCPIGDPNTRTLWHSPCCDCLANPFLAQISVLVVSQAVRPRRVRAPKGGGPNPGKMGPRRVGAPKVGPRKVGAQKFALFSPSPAAFSLFLSFSLLVEFSWCLKRRGSQMWALGLSCEAPALHRGEFCGIDAKNYRQKWVGPKAHRLKQSGSTRAPNHPEPPQLNPDGADPEDLG